MLNTPFWVIISQFLQHKAIKRKKSIDFSAKKILKIFSKIGCQPFRLTARLQIYCLIILYLSKYDNLRHILYKISLKVATVKCPRLGTSDRFCKSS